jgi:uncharacterized membrane protein
MDAVCDAAVIPDTIFHEDLMRRILALCAVPFLLVACGGGGDGATPPVTQSISLSVSTPSVTVARGASADAALTLSRVGSYTGTVTLTATGAPTGVTVTFSPASLTGSATSATANIAVGASAAPGTYTIGVTAAGSGVTSASTNISLTVPAPGITVTSSATASITQGGTTTLPITITRVNGFTDVVTITVTGLPTGVTAAALTIPAGSTTGTLTLTATGAATTGPASVVISAAGTGVTTQTATVNLTVAAASTPAFSLSAAPAAASVTAGQVAATIVTVSRTGGFTGDVALAVTGLPTGATMSLAPTTITTGNTTSTLSVFTTAAVTPGIYTITITGTANGVTTQSTTYVVTVAAVPAISIVAVPPTLSVAAGANGTSSITLSRTNFTGDVSFAATGLPTGVTASFAPATLTSANNTTTLTLTAAANATVGPATVTVTATGTGVTAQTTPIALTVTAAQGYSMTATAASLAQGGTGTSTVTLTRTGGFAGGVTLAVTGLPTGVTATIAPNPVTATSATVTFTATGAATTGAFTATVTGTATGLANVTTTIAGNVTASGGGGGGNATWTFCDAARFPVWFAYQNGTNGAWTAVTPTGTTTRVYSFNVSSVGAVAFVLNGSSGFVNGNVQYGTAAELTNSGTQECINSRARVSLTGTVAGLAAGQTGTITVGGSAGTVTGPATTYTIPQAGAGLSDLFAFRSAFNQTTFATTPDRGVLRRNVNYTSVIPLVDFAGAESFAIASAQYTVANAGGDFITASMNFMTNNGSAASISSGPVLTGNVATVYGVPSNITQSGDMHAVLIGAVDANASNIRGVYQYNQNLANRTITLGSTMNVPTVTSANGPYLRHTVNGSWQAEYPDAVGLTLFKQTASSNTWTMNMSRTYVGTAASTYTLAMPDFSATTGWNNTWAMTSGGNSYTASVIGYVQGVLGNNLFAENASWRTASRVGTAP